MRLNTSRLRTRLGELKEDRFLFYTAFLLVATLISNGSSFFYHVLVGRVLGPEEYGLFGALHGILYILSVSASAIQTSIARFVASLQARGERTEVNLFFTKALLQVVLFSIGVLAVLLALGPWIGSVLRASFPLVILVGIAAFLSLILPAVTGLFQGLERFYWLGLSNILALSLKLIWAGLFLLLGWGVAGALGAVSLGLVVALGISFAPVRAYLARPSRGNFDFSQLYRYSWRAALASFCFAAPTTIDVILARHFLPETTAGLYASAAVLGRVVVFLPMAVSLVMFPRALAAWTLAQPTGTLLRQGLLYTGILSGLATIFYVSLSPFLLGLLFGGEFTEAASTLRIYSLAMFFFSFTTICLYYNLALDSFKYVYLLASGTLLQFLLLLLFFHSEANQMAWVMALTSLGILLGGLAYTLTAERRQRSRAVAASPKVSL